MFNQMQTSYQSEILLHVIIQKYKTFNVVSKSTQDSRKYLVQRCIKQEWNNIFWIQINTKVFLVKTDLVLLNPVVKKDLLLAPYTKNLVDVLLKSN